MTPWQPDLYLKFKDERTQPSRDLAARVPVERPGRIIDIGCGPGNSTEVLRKRFPDAEIIGLDSSETMIEKACNQFPEGNWICDDAVSYEFPGRYDVIFSNAALQWIEDVDRLIIRLSGRLTDGGAIAVQVPGNWIAPFFKALREVAGRAEWIQYTGACKDTIRYHEPEFYYEVLLRTRLHIELWVTQYFHIMNSHSDLIEWHKSTGLRPYLESLPSEESRNLFIKAMDEEIRQRYRPSSDGKVLYPFRRIFFIAYKT